MPYLNDDEIDEYDGIEIDRSIDCQTSPRCPGRDRVLWTMHSPFFVYDSIHRFMSPTGEHWFGGVLYYKHTRPSLPVVNLNADIGLMIGMACGRPLRIFKRLQRDNHSKYRYWIFFFNCRKINSRFSCSRFYGRLR